MTPSTSISLLERLCQPTRREEWLEAWSLFLNLYTRSLDAWARQVTHHHENEAHDLVQEVFAKLIAKISTYDPKKGAFRVWLRTVMKNAWHELTRRGTITVSLPEDALLDSAEQVCEVVHRAEVAQHVRQLLGKYFPDDAKAFREVVEEGRPVAEVATKHGITPTALRMRFCRIRKWLRKRLEGLE